MASADFRIPTSEEIQRYQRGNTYRSPYLTAYFDIPKETRYTEYVIDFKVDHLPKGTYCSLGNWTMDHSALEKKFKQVRKDTDWIHAYAGFQRIATGRTTSIMSFWDVFCTDAGGRETTIEAKILYPKSVIDGGRFWGEGTGARCSAYFDWGPTHWYRMHLKCVAKQGTTYVEQWVQDYETGERTLLSVYDTCIADSAFQGPMAAFLENFLPETAGEVRSMEMCNVRYLDEKTGMWRPVKQVCLYAAGGMPAYQGSYDFDVSRNGHIRMITSGVGGDWFNNGKGKKGTWYTLG